MSTETFTVRVSDAAGNETVGTKTFGVGEAVTPISGNFAGLIPAGEHAHITGNVNLTGDLVVEGLLTGVDTFTLEGNGFQLLTQNGGQLNLVGVQKSGWSRWGDTPIGWQLNDALLVAPTAIGVFSPAASVWKNTWGLTTRPANSPDVPLPNTVIARPEVLNRSQTIVLKNLRRIHFHDGAGIQTLKWLKVLNSGVAGVLANYPIHFHLCGGTVRGSLLEGVIVDGGKNHAFVVHGSHGVTLKDCGSYNTINDAYWWDPPVGSPTVLQRNHTANNSHDTLYDHCLAMYVLPVAGDPGYRLNAFNLGAGHGNGIKDSAATCVQGGKDASGFHWPESANQNIDGNKWNPFLNNVAHNNRNDGIFVWQNDSNPHLIDGYQGYRNGLSQIDHGAYSNNYDYINSVLMGGTEGAFRLHAVGGILLENIIADTPLRVEKHNTDASGFTIVRNCRFPYVIYAETGNGGTKLSKIRYENCGLIPANFTFWGIVAGSIIEIREGGLQTHRWAGGSWQP